MKPGEIYWWETDYPGDGFYFIVGSHPISDASEHMVPAETWREGEQWVMHKDGRVTLAYGKYRKVEGEEADRIFAEFTAARLTNNVQMRGW